MHKARNSTSSGRPAEYGRWVRQCLRQLFDSPSLGTHPLAGFLLDRYDTVDRGQSMRRVLLDAIQALRPASGVPSHSYAWRTFRVLEMRFLEGLSPEEAMDQLALQKSQFYRDQARALAAIADYLWDAHQQLQRRVSGSDATSDVARTEALESETKRLFEEAGREQIDVNGLLCELGPVLDSLVNRHGLRLGPICGGPLRIARASRVLLRQAVLSGAAWALECSSHSEMEISTIVDDRAQGVRISVGRPGPPPRSSDVAMRAQLGPPIAQQVMATMGGSSQATESAGHREVLLTWPIGQTQVVLVIDDNRGFADLVSRYLSGHGWHMIAAPDGTAAREAIACVRPRVILLDVLMPHEDGWELLMALKDDGRATDIPVIICSVLEQPALATALGADAYLQKPVSEESLLHALAPWAASSASLASEPQDRPPRTSEPQ